MGNHPVGVADEASGPSRVRPGRRTGGIVAAVALVVVLLDVVSKSIVAAHLNSGESVRLLGGLIYFSLIRNSGAAFGLASGLTVLLALIAAAVVAVLVRVAARLRSVPWAIALGLLMGGALGNLLDRVFRAPGFLRGHVVDFISVFGPDAVHFPAFNLADSAVTIGAVVLAIISFLGIRLDGGDRLDAHTPEAPPAGATPDGH
jgi:signal peptidase II